MGGDLLHHRVETKQRLRHDVPQFFYVQF
jgi:hypothetical protein